MRSISRLLTLTTLAVIVGCGPRTEVRTIASPDAGFSGLHGFRMLPGPARRSGQAATLSDDPMINNSIANRALRAQIVKSFTELGYEESARGADFAVAFYASAREKLDVTEWDYGYPFFPRWGRPTQQWVTTYTEGTVIVDVLRASDRVLFWRGEGHTALTNDPKENLERLENAARAIVAKFPRCTIVNVAERRTALD